MTNKLPEKIGKYRIVDEIARGGMGTVYKAEHPTLDRCVVIKKLTLGGNAGVRERFRREAAIMMDFRDERIVDVYDHFREGPYSYIVQEYVDGLSLEGLLARERYLPERIALLIARDAALALAYAHDRGVVHRDIKPANLLVSKKGEVKLVDFGIARVEDEEGDALTREGMTLGTPSYMAPEQFGNSRNVDKRADIYSLGVLMYESTTGKKPFPGSISPQTIKLIQQGRCRSPRKLNPALTRFAAALVRKAMRARPERRFQELGPLVRRIDRRLEGLGVKDGRAEIAAFLAGTWTPPAVRGRAARAVLAAAGAVLACAAALAYPAVRYGWVYEAFRPDDYGAVRVTARVLKGGRDADRISPQVELFVDDGDRIPALPGGLVRFRLDPAQETEETAVFVGDVLYAPAGTYRLKAQIDGRLFWKDFRLLPRVVQRADPSARDGQAIVVAAARARSLPLEAAVRAVSAADGLTRVEDPAVFVQAGASWVPLAEAEADLRSGAVRRFRVEKEGYYPAYYSLAVQPFQSRLDIECELVPLPAALTISAVGAEVELRIDGSASYRAWGRRPEDKALPRIGAAAATLSIAPGRHVLSARRGSDWADAAVSLRAGESAVLVVEAASGGGLRFKEIAREAPRDGGLTP